MITNLIVVINPNPTVEVAVLSRQLTTDKIVRYKNLHSNALTNINDN